MVLLKKFNTIKEVQLLHKFAQNCKCDIGVHSQDGDIIVDAKSPVGLFCVDYSEPVKVVTEDESEFKALTMLFKNER